MIRRRRWLLLALVLGTGYVGARLIERAAVGRWLEQAHQAGATVDFHGLQEVAIAGARPLRARVRVVHQAPGDTRYDYLDGELAGLVVIETGGLCYRLDPAGEPTACRCETALPQDLAGYRARWRGRVTIAGRPAVRIELRRGGLTREWCLDRETAVVLCSLTTRPDGSRLETAFREFALGRPATPVSFDVPRGIARQAERRQLDELSATVGFTVSEPTWLPAGYRLVTTLLCDCPCGCGGCTAQLLYSDGVGTMSVFLGGDRCAGCFASDSACRECVEHDSALARDGGVPVVARVDRQPRVVVIGDLPQRDLARVAESVAGQPTTP